MTVSMKKSSNITSKIGYGYFAAAAIATISYLTCSAGNHDILDAQPEPPIANCRVGDTQRYYPSDGGLIYSDTGVCTSGTLTCKERDGGVTVWENYPSPDSSQKATETCNNKDDDCNGRIDDVPDLGASCSEGKGVCKRDGVLTCKPGNQFGCSAPMVSRVMTNYYACPHAPYEQKAYFDYDCDGSDGSGASPHLPIAGKLITGTFLGQAIQTASLPTIYDPNTSCVTQCSSVNTITYQYQTMQDKTIASSIKDNCGSVFKITKCEYKIAAASCQITDVETWAVYCK